MTLEQRGFPEPGVGMPVLVVAHPDDEALWFSSVLDRVGRIVVCFLAHSRFPELAEARRESLAKHPLADRIVSLEIEESRSFAKADWSDPVETDDGLELRADAAAAYAESANALATALPPLLADATAVITHNPWGEYGHEDHVQVCRIATGEAVQRQIPVFYSNYASYRSLPLLRRYVGAGAGHYHVLPTAPALGESIAEIYRACGAWTWFDDYRWFGHDCYIEGPLTPGAGRDGGWVAPINLVETRHDPMPPANRTAPKLIDRIRSTLSSVANPTSGRDD